MKKNNRTVKEIEFIAIKKKILKYALLIVCLIWSKTSLLMFIVS